uniref:Ionotropic glutamate receptor C-terminal domain-containing protein n=1 Tax=Anopheles quadriannulatus TaxID=34691 RepID=A0A182WT80_ANOQN
MFKMVENEDNVTITQAIRKGYHVVYDLDHTVQIYRWNRYSHQRITINPHNITVPDELRDLHGYNITMYTLEEISKVMTFDAYFLELIASKRNATAIQTDHYSYKIIDVLPLVNVQNMIIPWIVPSFGTTFIAVVVPRAKPKPIVSILIDPFDLYVWITYLMLVLTMAVTISMFGKFLGRRHFMEIVLELIMMCLAGPSRAYGGTFENRIITLFCLMGIVLVSSYQSLVISFMSFVRYDSEINTLDEIHERCLFRDNNDAKYFKFTTFPNGSHPETNAFCRVVSARDNEQQTIIMTSNTVVDKHAYATENYIRYRYENFRFAKTKFIEYSLCWLVKLHIRELFLFYVQAVFESGIYEYYYNNKSQLTWQYKHRTFVNQVVTTEDLLLLWYAYVVGMVTVSWFDESVKFIYFYPKWMYDMVQNEANLTITQALRKGYHLVYGLDHTLQIYRWNRYSHQRTTIDPHNITVPDELRDLHGYNITMYILNDVSRVMTFDAYFLELIANKRNATAVETDEYSSELIDVMPISNVHNVKFPWIVPSFGTTFLAVVVPRTRPKPIVSILFDPFDLYVWITYLVLVLTMAFTISLFGKLLGRRHFMEIVLELIMMCLAGPSRAYGGAFENRIITLFCLMGIVLVSSYQSLIISFMSYVRYGPEINTLDEIYERCLFPDSKYAKFFNLPTFPNGSHPGSDVACRVETARDNEIQTVTIDANFLVDKHAYATEQYLHHRIKNFRFAKTKFFEYPLCWYVTMHLRELFLFYVQAVFESGIYEYYYNNKSQPTWQYEHTTFVNQVVTTEDLLLLWYAYVVGMVVSMLSFAAETVIHKESFD